jgi:hypothetical protein
MLLIFAKPNHEEHEEKLKKQRSQKARRNALNELNGLEHLNEKLKNLLCFSFNIRCWTLDVRRSSFLIRNVHSVVS